MKIGVSGASGHLGKSVLKELIVRGKDHSLVGISRSPETVEAPAAGRLGNYDEPETLAQGYKDLDALLLIPSVDLRPGARGRQNVAAINAAIAAGVKHIVLISTVGTREEAEPDMGAAYWTGEQHLIKTASRWTILRMNYYAEALALEVQASLGTGVLTSLGENRVAFVARDDLAAAAAGILLGGAEHSGAIYNATGPAAVTLAERAAIASQITGKQLKAHSLTKEQLSGGLVQAGMPEDVVRAIVGIQTKFVNGAFDIVTGDVERLAGRQPRSLRDILSIQLSATV